MGDVHSDFMLENTLARGLATADTAMMPTCAAPRSTASSTPGP